MRHYFAAALIAVFLLTDFDQESSDVQIWAGSLVGVSNVPEVHPKDVTEPDNDVAASTSSTLPDPASKHYAVTIVDESPSDYDRFNSVSSGDEATSSTSRVCEAIKDAAEESGIPVSFFARLLWQESRFRSEVVSSAGARGIAQFMPQTAAEEGLSDPFDPLQAIPASAKFLRKLHNRFGNLGLAAAAYNAGGGRIEKWLSRRGPLPQETRVYVKIITGNKAEDWLAE